jgi:NhaA family Na+:H+ antiporter
MTIFFLVIGLEIKREFMVGELSQTQDAILPVTAAIGGMIMPASFYILFNTGSPNMRARGKY